MNTIVRPIIPFALILMLVPAIAAAAKKASVPLVVVASVSQGEATGQLIRSAVLEPRQLVKVLNEEPGRVTELHAYEGDRVRSGDILARQDDGLVRAEWNKARAQKEQAIAEWRRQQILRQEGMISDETYTQARTQVQVMIAQERLLAKRLDYMQISTPIHGVISERHVEQGDVAERYQHLFTIVDDQVLKLRLGIPGTDLARLAQQGKVEVSIDALSGRRFPARISRIFPVLDQTTHQATLEVELLPGFSGIRSGQLAQVHLPLLASAFPVIPLVALRQDEQGSFVYRLGAENKVERVAVQAGEYRGDEVEILNGLKTGEKVVVRGFAGLRPGQVVQVVAADEHTR